MVFVRIFLTESVSFIKLDILKYLGEKRSNLLFCLCPTVAGVGSSNLTNLKGIQEMDKCIFCSFSAKEETFKIFLWV